MPSARPLPYSTLPMHIFCVLLLIHSATNYAPSKQRLSPFLPEQTVDPRDLSIQIVVVLLAAALTDSVGRPWQ